MGREQRTSSAVLPTRLTYTMASTTPYGNINSLPKSCPHYLGVIPASTCSAAARSRRYAVPQLTHMRSSGRSWSIAQSALTPRLAPGGLAHEHT
jgi:hypothetical protein